MLQHTFYCCRGPYASTATWLAQSTWFATWSRGGMIPSNLDSTRILAPRHAPNMCARLCAHCYRPIALWKRLRTLRSSGLEAMHAPALRYQSGDATSSCSMYVYREAGISRATGHPLGMSALCVCGSSLRGKPCALCVGGVRRSSARRSHAPPFHFRTGVTFIIHPSECTGAFAYAYAQGYTLFW